MYAIRSTSRTICPSSVAGGCDASGVAEDPVAHRRGQIQPAPVALEHLDDPQRVHVVPELPAEPLSQAIIERLLADVTERRVAEIMAEPDRLDQILVERQRPRRPCARSA